MRDVKVNDVMNHLVVTLDPADSIHAAAQRLASNRISGAPVVEDGRVIGIVSESDLIHAAFPPARVDRGTSVLDFIAIIGRGKPRSMEHGKTVGEVMSPVVISTSPTTSIWAAASLMERKGIKRIPVVDDDGFLVGIVTRADLVKALARSSAEVRTNVKESIAVLGPETIEDLEVDVAEGIAAVTGHADRRSTHELAIKLAAQTPGVVEVIDRMTHEDDDTGLRAKIRAARTPDPDRRANWRPVSTIERTR